ncbi:MAG TPA: lysophospholipid acyltransferase family protein [Gemmatimonadaceae bacterium]|nr:lysophospholipid acyltransferase family protein [Gemmatimonadaceae bacterium]
MARKRSTWKRVFAPALNAWAWTSAVLVVLVGFFYVAAVFVVTAPFDRGRYAAGRAFRQLAVLQVKLNPLWDFHMSGEPISDPRHPYVAVSNHESYADIFLISHLPWEMKWLSKETIFKIPVMGWMMRMAGDVPLVRGNRDSTLAALAGCRDRLSKRVSVMIFPEGTRSRDGRLLPFKDGAFRLAIEAGVPILPIAVAGTRNAMAKGTFRFQHAIAAVRVLPPVETAGMTLSDIPTLKERVRDVIDQARHELARELDIGPNAAPPSRDGRNQMPQSA